MEMTRSMVYQASLSDAVWGEAVSTASSLRDFTATSSNNGKTSLEVLNKEVPFVGNLRSFGWEVWIFISKRKKLDSKSRRGILLRSLPHRKYRVWDIESRRVYHIRHLKINESVYPAAEWSQSDKPERVLRNWIEGWDQDQAGV